MKLQTDVSPASFLREFSAGPPGVVATLGPQLFESYCRLLHVESDASRREAENWVGDLGKERFEELRKLLEGISSPRAEIYACLWDGHGELYSPPLVLSTGGASLTPVRTDYSAFDVDLESHPKFELDGLTYLLFAGELHDAGDWEAKDYPDGAGLPTKRRINSPNLLWPATQTWFLTSHIDLPWTGFGGPRQLVETIASAWNGESVFLETYPEEVPFLI